MRETPVCPECAVPVHVTQEHSWLSDGSIVQARHHEHRMTFLETENFDPLFRGIDEQVAIPVIPIIVNVTRRSARAYMERLIPEEVRDTVQPGKTDPTGPFEAMYEVGRIMGYGEGRLIEARFEGTDDDFSITRFDNPCSRPIIAGSVAGTIEAFLGRDCGMTAEDRPQNAVEVKVVYAEHPPQWKERFWMESYTPAEGGMDLKRCQTCGGPAALKQFTWNLRMGIIRSATTDRRMGLIAPSMMQSVITELEEELDKTVAEIVIEAQRRFVRAGFYRLDEVSDAEEWRDQFALRGLGELEELSFSRRKMEVFLKNTALHLVMVGLVQGLFELGFGIESRAEWELDGSGGLRVKVTPW